MRNLTCRHYRRNLLIGSCLLMAIPLFIRLQLHQPILNIYDTSEDDPLHCNQAIIRKHFMNDKTPQELFAQAPVREGFDYEIANGNFCSPVKPHAIIFVISKSRNYDSRSAIRRTWGNLAAIKSLWHFSHLELRIIFLIDIDESLLLSISLEHALFHDIVQVHLPQQYSLSTYRDMAMLHWTDTYCSEAILTVKTDDDIFINTYLLANLVNVILKNTTIDESKLECKHSDSSAIIYGYKLPYAKVVRYSNDPALEGTRYIVTKDEYPCEHYPSYMSGFSYIVNRPARSKVLCTFLRDRKPFHMSDVYVTGIIPEYIGIERRHFGLAINYRSSDDCEHFFKQNDADSYACASSLHYNKKQIDTFERFHVYWQHVYENRFLYINRKFNSMLKGLKVH
ncbi:unnamed protein product [Rotaria magnacalcarata]|uniref:Hexosyltransferase n=1 Tax=Rotaria magnacalcarata TaxID=392030 RepID=A0A815LQX8_9BILA|nr:unnamed protein product [Rotaria magnacalcarata]CAF1480021.1 unnamed protein product [Rotaria magnacalcarata]CAF1933822.1 unnamed protein product [Rotaria magnacalcarata]CAF4022978.1 unnamed protein product [Rotaria magnacalcarata]CAF4034634.1 unnamed protein product [Rotaria magnacalcarata]